MRTNRPSAATPIRRDPIKSCTKRFAELDQGGKLDAGIFSGLHGPVFFGTI
jgi:hypothetical protein